MTRAAQVPSLPRLAHLVGGRWNDGASNETRAVLDPFDGSTLAEVPEGQRADAAAAVSAARAAFDDGAWTRTPARERAALLARIGDAVEQNAEQLARLETHDTGKTLEESRWDMQDVAAVFRYYGELARELERDDVGGGAGEALEAPSEHGDARVFREPAGVCSMILPWNYPLLQAAWKIAPALAAGCTMVVKPSELTPLTTLRLSELAVEAGAPAGVLNTVLGAGPTVGAELCESAAVDLVSFTGGLRTGKAIMRAAADTVKRVALELGGKNPNVIFADADLDVAVDAALEAVFFHAGQICSAGARLMVQAPVYQQVVDALAARVAAIRLGDGLDEGTEMGPLISAAQRERVAAHVTRAREAGATVLCGGAKPSSAALADGFFYEPTLIVDCADDAAILRDEVFGPVMTVERFDDEHEAVRRANDTVYGLAAGFFTGDEARVGRVSRALRFGTVWVNAFNVYFPQAPWGGFKQSGVGRELGRAGLDEYCELKHVYRDRQPSALGWFGRGARGEA